MATSPFKAINQGATPGTLAAYAGVPGNRIRLLQGFGSMTATGTLQFISSGGRILTGVMTFTGGVQIDIDASSIENGEAWMETDTGEGLSIVTGTSGFNGCLVAQYVPG